MEKLRRDSETVLHLNKLTLQLHCAMNFWKYPHIQRQIGKIPQTRERERERIWRAFQYLTRPKEAPVSLGLGSGLCRERLLAYPDSTWSLGSNELKAILMLGGLLS